ncbi:MAG: RNA methyltransferase [Actinomycetales bacterium]|nr:RNA methyltransferase [Actinomycetales bacterium]
MFLVEGPQAVREVLAFHPEIVGELYLTPAALERHGRLVATAAERSLQVETVSEAVIEAMADTVTPQGVVAVCRQPEVGLDAVLRPGARLVAILDEVRDPGNAGTIIRAADAAGADGVVVTRSSVDVFNPKVVRSTTGSLFHLPVAQGVDREEAIAAARAAGLQVLAADVSGVDLPELDDRMARPTAWLFGNEARGLDDATLGLVEHVVKVPIYGHAESMNLATAASVCLYQTAFAQRIAARRGEGS